MKHITKIAVFIAVGMLLARVAAAGTISGELGLKESLYSTDRDTIYRLQEYSALPKDGSVSLFGLNYYVSPYRNLSLFGTDPGANDSFASLGLNLNKAINYQESYQKITHLIDAQNGYYTERSKQSQTLYLYQRSDYNAVLTTSTEDKVGRTAFADFVGHKVDETSVAANARILSLLFTGGIWNQKLNDNNAAHDADGVSGSVTLAPASNVFAEIAVDNKKYDPSLSNQGKTLEKDKLDYSVSFNPLRDFTLTSFFSTQKRDSDAAGLATYQSLSFEDNYFSTTLDYSGKIARIGFIYKNTERDYTGADLASLKTDSLQVKIYKKFEFLGLKADVTKGSRDISGVTNANLIDFNELSGNYGNVNYSVNLLGFKKFGLTYYGKTSFNKYDAYSTYGTSVNRSRNWGFTSYYVADQKTTFTSSYYEFQNRTEGRQLFWLTDPAAGRIQLDTNLQMYDGASCFQIGTSYEMMPSTTLTADFLLTSSELKDPQQNDKIDERILSLGLERLLTSSYSVNLGYTYNEYIDDVSTIYGKSNSRFDMELKKKF